MQKLKFLALFTTLAVTGPASAGLLNQSVTGSLILDGDTTNYFDPPLTTTIQDPGSPEFSYDDGFETWSADFTDTSLIITYDIYSDQLTSAVDFTMTFSLNSGLFVSVTKDSDSFDPFVTWAPTGNTLTIDWAGIAETDNPDTGDAVPILPQTFIAKFNIEATIIPEPSILALMSLGLAGIGVVKRRRVLAASA